MQCEERFDQLREEQFSASDLDWEETGSLQDENSIVSEEIE